jgi:hypothetical protein
MHPFLLRTAMAAILASALGVPLAHADVYTWTDASGRLNVGNIAPPEGVRVSRVVHEDPSKVRPAPPPRDAAREAEMQALTDRVAQLQDEVDRAQRQPPLPIVAYRAAAPAPPVQVVVNVVPPPPATDYAASPAYPPGCDPTVFGCPAFGYPVGVVVLKAPRLHRFDRFDRLHRMHRVAGAPGRAAPPANFRRR